MDVVAEIVRRAKPRRTLSIAHNVPAWAAELGGEFVHIGGWSAPSKLLVKTIRYREALTTADTIRELESMLPSHDPDSPFDIVFIDHRHDAASVVAQYNAAWRLSSAGTIFLFDDAVPRSVEMARAVPGPGWWVGQVWMLRHILIPSATGILEAVDTGATGLMIAMDCGPIDPERSRETIERLDQVQTFAELQASLPVIMPDQCSVILDRLVSASIENSAVLVTPVEQVTPIKARTVLDEEIVRPHRQPEFVADLSSYGLDTSSLRRPEDRTPSKYLEEFSEIYVLAGSEFYANGQCFFKNARHPDLAARQMVNGERYVPSGAGHSDDAGNLWLQKDYLKQAAPLPSELFMATPDEIDNWGMWLLYGLPALEHFVSHASDYRGVFIATHQGWQRKLIEYMGVEPDAVHAQEIRKPYFARDLSMTRYSFRNLSVPESDRQTFERLRHRALERGSGARTPRRIFVSRLSRSRAGAYRSLVNEAALIEGVTALGFDIVEPESLSFEQQIQLFAGAEVVVGLGGAGIFNVVFCKEGTKVVTIESTLGFIGSHSNIFATMGLDYGLILGREDRDDPALHHKRWSVDVAGVTDQLRQFC